MKLIFRMQINVKDLRGSNYVLLVLLEMESNLGFSEFIWLNSSNPKREKKSKLATLLLI